MKPFYKIVFICIVLVAISTNNCMEDKIQEASRPNTGGVFLFFDQGWKVASLLNKNDLNRFQPLILNLTFLDTIYNGKKTCKKKYLDLSKVIDFDLSQVIDFETSCFKGQMIDLDITPYLEAMNHLPQLNFLEKIEVLQAECEAKQKEIDTAHGLIEKLLEETPTPEELTKIEESFSSSFFNRYKNTIATIGVIGALSVGYIISNWLELKQLLLN